MMPIVRWNVLHTFFPMKSFLKNLYILQCDVKVVLYVSLLLVSIGKHAELAFTVDKMHTQPIESKTARQSLIDGVGYASLTVKALTFSNCY